MADHNVKKWPSLGRGTGRGTLTRGRPSFLTRTATDDAGELLRRSSLSRLQDVQGDATNTSAPTNNGHGAPIRHAETDVLQRSQYDPRSKGSSSGENAIASAIEAGVDGKHPITTGMNTAKTSSSAPEPDKLNTFSGVFVPTSLNVLSILMFIRFGFILGQTGLLGMLGLLVAAYVINLVTTFSISAVASNGTVRGGGAYYLISRSLGPEFGGSIGIVSYIGFVLNTGMNAVGLVDCLIYNFGTDAGVWANWLPETGWWPYLWSTCVVVLCVLVCLAGSALFSRASNALLLILLVATFSIPLSAALVGPFRRPAHRSQYTHFTGLNLDTLKENLLPRFSKGASGSQINGRETWADMFGILFPATGGIFAGASMSGDLKSPSKSIPSGTLYGILLTFVSYALVIIAMAASITRLTFYKNVNVIQDVNLSGVLILLGEIATTSFSVLMGIIGPAKQLQAIARDGIFPGLGVFGQGTKKSDDPVYAIIFTWIVAQITILFDINSIASVVTMSYLMMNFALHLACLLLKASSAPNFRPSFRFFNLWTALFGAVLSVATMFFVDGSAAAASIAILISLFVVIHYTTPPKAWGADVTSGLVYHQVRKYLLRLKTESVKYWRPQILLFVNDPRRGYKLISFANSLKKGGLFILGHVIVTDNFGDSVPEAKKQRAAWTQFIDLVKIKAFINVIVAPSMEWGARNLVFSAGLGGMRPNIVMMGFFNLEQFRQEQPLIDIPERPMERTSTIRKRRRSHGQVKGALPTDTLYVEKRTDLQSYVLTVEDLVLKLRINLAVATGFSDLELPNQADGTTKKYIDLWPIQMSATIAPEDNTQSTVTTTNFDTYTLILQLGCILNTVPAWKKTYKLRVAVFVEYESDVQDERARVETLLENLRIKAEVLVFYLACGRIKSYNAIVNGEDVDEEAETQIQQVLEEEDWWKELRQIRGKVQSGEISAADAFSFADDTPWPLPSFNDRREPSIVRYAGLRQILQQPRRRSSLGNLSSMGVVPSMRTHRLDDDLISSHAFHASDTSDLEPSDGSDNDYFDDESENNDFDYDEDDDEHSEVERLDSEGQKTPKLSSSRKISSKKSSKKSSKRSSRKSSHRGSGASSLQALPRDSVDEVADLIQFNQIVEPSAADRGRRHLRAHDSTESLSNISPSAPAPPPARRHRSHSSSPSFTASPNPPPNEEANGPSIVFAEQPHPKHKTKPSPNNNLTTDSPPNTRSIYARTNLDTSPDKSTPAASTASGYPSAASMPLSFNDVPNRAQHLILNELISQNSEDTAVIFTTLPAPPEGTWKSEDDSLGYITSLEVLTQGLGPVLMVHSNSMTVTTNL